MPLFYCPVKFADKVLVDGGIVNPVPDDVAKRMGADIVIAVNLNHYRTSVNFHTKSITAVSSRSLDIVFEKLAEYSLQPSTILIEPKMNYTTFESWKKYFILHGDDEIIKAGEDAARKPCPG